MNFISCPSQDLSRFFNLLFEFSYPPIWSFLVFIFFPFFIPLHSFSFLNCLAHSINCIYYSTNVVSVAKVFLQYFVCSVNLGFCYSFFSFIRRSLPSIFSFVDAFRVCSIFSNLNRIILVSSSSSSLIYDFFLILILLDVFLDSNWFNGSYIDRLWFYIISIPYCYKVE